MSTLHPTEIYSLQNSWEKTVEDKRAVRRSKIPTEWLFPQNFTPEEKPNFFELDLSVVLTEEELELTSAKHDATDLIELLAQGKVTSETVTRAFCKRAAIAHQFTNCLTEIMFDEAVTRARMLDKHFKDTGKPIGPLHGLPISVKDCYDITGYDTSCGIVCLCNEPAKENSQVVQIFLDYGAIPFVKTNVPQTMLTADTDSVVFGRTLNPHNRLFGAGGSSGGEGALIAACGSPFGIGNDGAGSVRMPAFVNGIYGYKPSGDRIPLDGRGVFGKGLYDTTCIGPKSVTGWLTRSIRDAQLATRLVAQAEPWQTNPFIYPHPWLNINVQKPRIGVWHENGFLHLHPPVQRAFENAQKRLVDAGIELVPFTGPSIEDVWELQKEYCEIQDLSTLREWLSKEPTTGTVKAAGIIYPKETRPTITKEYLHEMNSRIASLVVSMVKAWNETEKPIDALLWVPAPHTAVPFDKYTYLGFTGLFNVIDWPAVVLPTGDKVDKSVDHKTDIKPFNDFDAKMQALYDPEKFHGLSTSIQLIGRRFEDEKLLSIASCIQGVINASRSLG